MKGKIEFSNKFFVRGMEIKSLDYDTNNLTAEACFMAYERADERANSKSITIYQNYRAHQEVAIQVLIASNPDLGLVPEDFKTLRGADVMKVYQVGMLFVSGADEPQAQSSSDEPSAPTPNDSTPPQAT